MAFDWKALVGEIAPTLGTVLTTAGPAGMLAGAGINVLATMLTGGSTGDQAKDEAGISAALAGGVTPEIRAKIVDAESQIKLATMQFADKAKERELEELKTQLADTQSARARDVELAKAGKTNDRANWMVAFDGFGLVSCLIVLAFFRQQIPGEVVGLLSTIASIFGLCLRDAHQFEFGSSRGSKDKDAALADALKR